MDIQQELITLRNALYDFSRRNPFVYANKNKLWFIDTDEGISPEKIWKKARFYKQEYGLDTVLDVSVFIQWSPPGSESQTDNDYLISPLLYKESTLTQTRKIAVNYTLDSEDEVYKVNPVLRHYFNQFYKLDLPESFGEIQEGIDFISDFFNDNNSGQRIVTGQEFTAVDGWQIITCRGVGNFNYKRSALGTDYEVIMSNPGAQVSEILFGDKKLEVKSEDFNPLNVLDRSQYQVISEALNNNIVIQGPPGTGKSHTIVSLIGALLEKGKRVLLVSEKRSALEVVYNRLEEKGLHNLVAHFNTDKNQKKTFYQNLGISWEKLNTGALSDDMEITYKTDGLFDIYPKRLLRESDDNGKIKTLIDTLLKSEKNPAKLKAKGKIPDLKEWNEGLGFLQENEDRLCEAFHADTLAESVFVRLNRAVFSEEEVMLKLEKRLDDLNRVLNKIIKLQNKFILNETLESFTRLALAASILNMVDNVQIDLLNSDAKKYRSFNNWSKKYQLLKVKLNQAEQANKAWTAKPSMSEITELMSLLSDHRQRRSGSILGRLKRNPSRLKTAFRDFHSGISDNTRIKLLESVKLEWRLKGELEEVKVKLRHNLNITDPDNEIDLIFNLRNKLDGLSQVEYLKILEHPDSKELIEDFSQIHPDIVQFNSQKRFLFSQSETESIEKFDLELSELRSVLPQINHWLPELKSFFGLPEVIRKFVRSNKEKVSVLNEMVAYHNLLQQTRFETQFNKLSGWELTQDLIQLQSNDKSKQIAVINRILGEVIKRHNRKENLLTKPAYRLKKQGKERKKQYKAARRQIIHEINKKQRHMPVRTFFESVGEYLLDLLPVWSMNPLTLSENLPCKPGLFDVVIFDESSQIPLEDAIPAIYRAKQVVVVGDSKQMPPSSFFKGQIETPTVLDRAEEVFNKRMLKWHYRSKHPDLIRFSNSEFYGDELITLPPKSNTRPIEFVHCPEAVYESGINEAEAKSIGEYLAEKPISDQKSILIIAFSVEQEKVIQKIIKDFEAYKQGRITTRNLENAQGIEADVVILSIGYGRDKEGKFRMNFGPVNRADGANRLNVLFTRAIEKMIVFSSVQSTDFELSANRGVQLLKGFLAYVEEKQTGTLSKIEAFPLGHHLVKELLDKEDVSYDYYSSKRWLRG